MNNEINFNELAQSLFVFADIPRFLYVNGSVQNEKDRMNAIALAGGERES